jgi:hypothetical protein
MLMPTFDGGVGSWSREELIKFENLVRERDLLTNSGQNVSSPKFVELNERIATQRQEFSEALHYCGNHLRNGFSDFAKADNEELTRGLHRYERYLRAHPSDLKESEVDLYKRFLEEAITEIGELLRTRGADITAGDQYVERITREVKKQAEIIRRLEEACETDIKAHPEQEKQIRRTYRQAIDALKDE